MIKASRSGMGRRQFLGAAVTAAFVTAVGGRSATAADRTNFVIVIGDDVAWDDHGCYGHPHIRTPRVDAMAKQGVLFHNAYLTISSCSPSRASIMTGMYPHNTGAGELHLPLAGNKTTMASMLKAAGYYTVSAGKFHLGDIQSHFDLVEGGKPSGCEEWVRILQQRPQDKPFFCWYAASDAHRGWSATTGPNAIAQPHTLDEMVVPPYLPDTETSRKDLAQYCDEVSRLDDYLGKVLDELENQGVLENTFVLYMSDNGRPFPRCKTTLYDSGLKTPFIVHWPAGAKRGIETDSLVSAVDIAATIIAIAGLEAPPTFAGKSFASLLQDPAAEIRDYVHGEHNWHDYQAHERSVRTKKHLYIFNAFPELPGTPPADAVGSTTFQEMRMLRDAGKLTPAQMAMFVTPRAAEELYDVIRDPHQLENLAGKPEYASILAELRSVYETWAKKTDDRVPDPPSRDGFDRETGQRLMNATHPSLATEFKDPAPR